MAETTCASCGGSMAADDRFCQGCGAQRSSLAAMPASGGQGSAGGTPPQATRVEEPAATSVFASRDGEDGTPDRGRGWLVAGAVAVVVAVLAAGGWWLLGSGEEPSATTAGATTPDQQDGGAGGADTAIEPAASAVPDVLGMAVGEAEAVLADAGYSNIERVEQESDEAADTVLEQAPQAGDEAEPGSVIELTVAIMAPVALPRVLGDDIDGARAELEDLGLAVTVTRQDSARPEGEVLDQAPAAGEEVDAGSDVELVVAQAMTTPDFSGMTIEEISAAVEEVGGQLDEQETYVPDQEEGTFVSQEPEAGAPMEPTTTVTIAGPPAFLYLEELESVANDWWRGPSVEDINGESYAHSFYNDRRSDSSVEYNLSRDFDEFRAMLGYEDGSAADGRIHIEIFTDGSQVFTGDFGLGQGEEVSVDVQDVLRLKIILTNVGDSRGYGIVGEGRLIGDPEVIAEYESSDD